MSQLEKIYLSSWNNEKQNTNETLDTRKWSPEISEREQSHMTQTVHHHGVLLGYDSGVLGRGVKIQRSSVMSLIRGEKGESPERQRWPKQVGQTSTWSRVLHKQNTPKIFKEFCSVWLLMYSVSWESSKNMGKNNRK